MIANSRYLEELAANALPAAVVQVVDGWRLRFNWGVTRRANSVWPNEAGNIHTLTEKLAIVEAFYRRWGGPARYQICPAAQPGNLDELLAERGYTTNDRTCVQTASLDTVLAQTQANPAYEVILTETFDEQWFAAYCHLEQVNASAAQARQTILQRIGPKTGYALLQKEGQPLAVGLAVVERGWAGLFNMATQTAFRRQGAATAILHTLAKWSRSHQATQLYLQVVEKNPPARTLYSRLGFETAYYYHYRKAPEAGTE